MAANFQFEDSGVEIIEIMPPAVKTDITVDLSDGDGITLISTDELVRHSQPCQPHKRKRLSPCRS